METDRPTKKSGKETARRIVLIVAAISFMASAVYLAYDLVWTPIHIRRLQSEVSSVERSSTQQTTAKADTLPVQEKYASLKAKYPDFVGKLTIAGIDMDFPVVQTTDNTHYLKYTIDGVRDKHGALFVDYRNDLTRLDQNTIVYGHNMKDGTQFGQLNLYKKLYYYKDCPVVTFNTIYHDYQWKIFAAFLINTKAEDDNNHLLYYWQTKFPSDDAFNAFYKEALERSYFLTGVDVTPQDKLLTMSTCSTLFDDSRFVVLARLVRDGESAEVDTSAARVNPNQKFPQAVYDAEN